VHTDPLATSAWNTVLRGRKRWVLFPPDTPRRVGGPHSPPPSPNLTDCSVRTAKGLDELRPGEDDEAVNYFADLLPRIRERHGLGLGLLEFVQEAGQTVFVPGGWWHGVLNLDDSVAVTQVTYKCAAFDGLFS